LIAIWRVMFKRFAIVKKPAKHHQDRKPPPGREPVRTGGGCRPWGLGSPTVGARGKSIRFIEDPLL
jgi:hypothetical protein